MKRMPDISHKFISKQLFEFDLLLVRSFHLLTWQAFMDCLLLCLVPEVHGEAGQDLCSSPLCVLNKDGVQANKQRKTQTGGQVVF